MFFLSGNFLLWATLVVAIFLVLALVAGAVYGFLKPDAVAKRPGRFRPVGGADRVAVLIACRNGGENIAETVRAARRNGSDVYVVSDQSTDLTAWNAAAAGARVLSLKVNVGKPAALHQAYEHFMLGARYEAVAILDDDVIIEDDFVARCLEKMDTHTAIVVGKNITLWPQEYRWNVWLAKRAYSYWNYQLFIRRLQSLFGVMNCISGSNSIYRVELLDKVLPEPPPYIVDDTFWVLETQRKDYGAIVYAPKARAHLQDPTNFKDWYKQNKRWLWGTFQGIRGHRVGRQWSRFDFAYCLLMLQWVSYVGLAPFSVWVLVSSVQSLGLCIAIFMAWTTAAAINLRKPQLILFAPAIIVVDIVYRVIFVHAFIKAWRQPTSECKWVSPIRFSTP